MAIGYILAVLFALLGIILIKKAKKGLGIFILILGVLIIGFTIFINGDFDGSMAEAQLVVTKAIAKFQKWFNKFIDNLLNWLMDTWHKFAIWFKSLMNWRGNY